MKAHTCVWQDVVCTGAVSALLALSPTDGPVDSSWRAAGPAPWWLASFSEHRFLGPATLFPHCHQSGGTAVGAGPRQVGVHGTAQFRLTDDTVGGCNNVY